MTVKSRSKLCLKCRTEFYEKPRESNLQWENRLYCSIACNNASAERFTDIFTRLESKQIKSDGCWGWAGSVDGGGYGTLSNRRGSKFSPEKAHRLSYELNFGEIPKGLFVCHKCDNPQCTNPDHLFIGTQKDNMQDCSKKGRLAKESLKNLNHRKSLSGDQVDEIRRIKFCAKNGRGEGEKVSDVAKRYGVCRDLITDIKLNRYEA